ncbi:MAG: fibronectin type III domain-containing protein [Eubacterium sp.]|nr:fibronectin type III domain-containing protein [Eubacterium sp.]
MLKKSTPVPNFKIIPKATKLESVKALKKGFRAKWKKGKGQITGYQIRWSRKADMSGAKKKRITSKKKLSYEKTKLKAGKKYYVQIRT